MDISNYLSWFFPILPAGLAYWVGRYRAKSGKAIGLLESIWIAVVIGVAFTIGQILTYAGCQKLELCRYVGDQGASFVFQSFLATPVYWVLLVLAKSPTK
jgi:hypothetical protein